jgi:hypothetical protein
MCVARGRTFGHYPIDNDQGTALEPIRLRIATSRRFNRSCKAVSEEIREYLRRDPNFRAVRVFPKME